jgi:exodeoxyribonuclease VII small subunit
MEDLAFEAARAELEQIVRQLEEGALNLEQMIVLYERGQLLARHCQALLDQADLRILRVTGETS